MRRVWHRSSGFALIELLIAIAIVGIMTAAVVPFLQQMQTGYERRKFIARVNSLTQTAWQQAIITGAVHRVLFDFKERTARVERDVSKEPSLKKVEFKPVSVAEGSMNWPASIEIRQFIIGGFDEMKRAASGRTTSTWFYLIPDGMAQAVTINGIDTDERIDGKPKQFGLVLNPFFAQFKVYDAYQK